MTTVVQIAHVCHEVNRGVCEAAGGTMSRFYRQKRVGNWVRGMFGDDVAMAMPERGKRLAEEALEAAQAAGIDEATALRLVMRVFSRPAGTLQKEVGQVGVTLLALAEAAGIDADQAELCEVIRISTIPKEVFAARHAAKVEQGVAV
jgi:NTP pyrophosphatase (non-canonical NTP hydrolase)